MMTKNELLQALLQLQTLVFEDSVYHAWANIYDDDRTEWRILDDRGEVVYTSFAGLFAAMERLGSIEKWSVKP